MPQIKLQLASGKVYKCAALADFPANLAASVDLIDARRCGLREFDPRPFRNLEVALLSSNALEAFPDFGKCHHLRFLQIYSNNFTAIRPRCVPRSLQEVIIDDLGPQLYPVSRSASVRLYDGYGRASDVISQARLQQIRAEYIAWCDRQEAYSVCDQSHSVCAASNAIAQENSMEDNTAPQNPSFRRETETAEDFTTQSFEDQPAIDLELSQGDELKCAQPKKQLRKPASLVID